MVWQSLEIHGLFYESHAQTAYHCPDLLIKGCLWRVSLMARQSSTHTMVLSMCKAYHCPDLLIKALCRSLFSVV